tara:strand:- start:35 stop:331 length:297 start_codon:yes stop_codon:yes gene_type:complete
MKQFKGTQGEWKAVNLRNSDETKIVTSTHRIAEVKHYGCKISYTLLEPTKEEGKANAKLIAASKKLLKALQGLLRDIDMRDDFYYDVAEAEEAINEAL